MAVLYLACKYLKLLLISERIDVIALIVKYKYTYVCTAEGSCGLLRSNSQWYKNRYSNYKIKVSVAECDKFKSPVWYKSWLHSRTESGLGKHCGVCRNTSIACRLLYAALRYSKQLTATATRRGANLSLYFDYNVYYAHSVMLFELYYKSDKFRCYIKLKRHFVFSYLHNIIRILLAYWYNSNKL